MTFDLPRTDFVVPATIVKLAASQFLNVRDFNKTEAKRSSCFISDLDYLFKLGSLIFQYATDDSYFPSCCSF
jgi:hypothetical protein